MLRKSVRPFIRKDISVPLLCKSENKEVIVEVSDPLSGEPIAKRVEHISQVRKLSEESAVSNEPADLYSIENMMRVGMSPVVCPRGGYYKNNLDTLDSIENASIELLDRSEVVPSPNPSVESPNNEE